MRRAEPSLVLLALALLPLALDAARPARRTGAPPSLPAAGPGFAGEDEALAPSEKRLLEGIPAVRKRYRFGEHIVSVLVFDAMVDRHVVHEPTYCLEGGGFRVVRDEDRGGVRRVRAEEPGTGRVRSFACCFESGGECYTSRWRYMGEYLRWRWWPGAHESIYRVIAATADPGTPGEDWLAERVLPAVRRGAGGSDLPPVPR